MRLRLGWPSKRMPNRSNASRSNQSAAFHTPITDGTTGSSARRGTLRRMRCPCWTEYRWYTASKRSSRSG